MPDQPKGAKRSRNKAKWTKTSKRNKLKWAKIVVKRPRTSYKDLQVYHTHNQAGLGKPVINTKDCLRIL